MNAIPSLFAPADLAALTHQLRQWLTICAAMLLDWLADDSDVGRVLRHAAHGLLADLEFGMKLRLCVLLMLERSLAARRKPARPPFVTRRGFRRHERRGSALRHVTRGLFARTDIATRIARLLHMLHHPDQAIAHIRRRVRRGLVNGRLAICAVGPCVVRALAAPVTACADTS